MRIKSSASGHESAARRDDFDDTWKHAEFFVGFSGYAFDATAIMMNPQ